MMSRRCAPCFIVPSRVLIDLGDPTSALLSERMRGQRIAAGFATFAAVPAGQKRRTIYDAGGTKTLPGQLVRGEGDPASADKTVNAAYDNAGVTYDFYGEVLKRNSIDGRGLRLDSTVHYGTGYNNAGWNGQQMIYGDGDGRLFIGFASALEVVAHELTHGVTQYTVAGGLIYDDQSGALNESISDVFGSVVKQWEQGQTVDQADWLIGLGIMGPTVGKALRSMKNPGDRSQTWKGDDQPGDMSGYVEGGDVHTNSGIPNHAFFLAATALGGKSKSWTTAAPIWYRALSLLKPNATFADAAKATTDAVTLLGLGSTERDAVQSAWHTVGVI